MELIEVLPIKEIKLLTIKCLDYQFEVDDEKSHIGGNNFVYKIDIGNYVLNVWNSINNDGFKISRVFNIIVRKILSDDVSGIINEYDNVIKWEINKL